jgi:PAS domain S-box-containing protein
LETKTEKKVFLLTFLIHSFVSSKDEQDYSATKELIVASNEIQAPIISFDFYINSFTTEVNKLNRKRDINFIKEFSKKFQWNDNVDEIFKGVDFETIVLTNEKQEILWVNDGFKEMTGYTKTFALKKTPSFLQGKNTCAVTRKRIRNKILANEPFKEIVLNYKQDKTPYKCEINVFPLSHKNTTHYIALERAI